MYFFFSQLCALKKEWRPVPSYTARASSGNVGPTVGSGTGSLPSWAARTAQETLELRKIKKVQSFFRGWLCRRRWKQIVEQYIKSPHAESMRKRNRWAYRGFRFHWVQTNCKIKFQIEPNIVIYLKWLALRNKYNKIKIKLTVSKHCTSPSRKPKLIFLLFKVEKKLSER